MTTWKLPIKTVSEANSNEHWTRKKKRHDIQKLYIRLWATKNNIGATTLPAIIKLTRVAPRELDCEENLPMSFKWIKDYIADQLIPGQAAGRADGDKRIKWDYFQEKGEPKEYAIKIEIIPLGATNFQEY